MAKDRRIGNVSSEAVAKATGKSWVEWFDFLNRKGGVSKTHKERVALLASTVESMWWRQKISSAYETHKGSRVTGQVATGGYQMGIQKTLAQPARDVWAFITSEEGLALWLGVFAELNLKKGGEYKTRGGVTGKFNVIGDAHLRLTWKPRGWTHASMLQVRVIGKKNACTVSFHHDSLPAEDQREKMKKHWEKVLARIEKNL